MDTLYFAWIDKPVDIEKNLQLPQFSMHGYIQHDCSQNYTAGNIHIYIYIYIYIYITIEFFETCLILR